MLYTADGKSKTIHENSQRHVDTRETSVSLCLIDSVVKQNQLTTALNENKIPFNCFHTSYFGLQVKKNDFPTPKNLSGPILGATGENTPNTCHRKRHIWLGFQG